jgi:hypothetical protein
MPATNVASRRPQPRPQTSATEDLFDYRVQAALMRAAAEAPVPTPPASRAALPAAAVPMHYTVNARTAATTSVNRPRPSAYIATGVSDISDDGSSVEELEILAPPHAGKKRSTQQSLPQESFAIGHSTALPAAKKHKTPRDTSLASKRRSAQNAPSREKTIASTKKDAPLPAAKRGGRQPGAGSYTPEDVEAILDLAADRLPVGSDHWKALESAFNEWAVSHNRPTRDWDSIKKKFMKASLIPSLSYNN